MNTQKRFSPRAGGMLGGCLIVLLIVVVLVAAGGFWLYKNGKTLLTDTARNHIVEVIQASAIDEEERVAMVAQVDRLAEGFKAGEVSAARMAEAVSQLSESPIFSALIAVTVSSLYIEPSDLSEAEKDAGRVTMQRLAAGMIQDRFDESDLDRIFAPVTGDDSGDERALKEQVTADELRTFIENARQLADDAGIPEQPQEVSLAAELERFVDRILGQGGTAP